MSVPGNGSFGAPRPMGGTPGGWSDPRKRM